MVGGFFVFLFPFITQFAVEFVPPSSTSSDTGGVVAPADVVVRVPALSCELNPEALWDFFQNSEVNQINGDESFIIMNPGSNQIMNAALVDVSSSLLPYWYLNFERVQNLQGQIELHFSPIGFGCETCILLLERESYSKCSPMAVSSSVADRPDPNGYFSLGTFISGGLGGDSADGNQNLIQSRSFPLDSAAAGNATTSRAQASSGCQLGFQKWNTTFMAILILFFGVIIFCRRLKPHLESSEKSAN